MNKDHMNKILNNISVEKMEKSMKGKFAKDIYKGNTQRKKMIRLPASVIVKEMQTSTSTYVFVPSNCQRMKKSILSTAVENVGKCALKLLWKYDLKQSF